MDLADAKLETARAFGQAMDAGDAIGLKIAQDAGNNIITLDAAETERWKVASQPTPQRPSVQPRVRCRRRWPTTA
jgi:hypothetical protein